MNCKFLSTLGISALALAASVSASHAGYFVPGETMGFSLLSPLPEGLFLADLETYGRADKQPDANVGVNIPLLIWSTPWTFYNNRIEILAGAPFVHTDTHTGNQIIDNPANVFGAATYALGPALSHDFGNGLSGGIGAFIRTPDPSTNVAHVFGQTIVEGDFRESAQYVMSSGPLSGVVFMENAGVTSALGQHYSGLQPGAYPANLVALGFPAPEAQNDQFAGDFTIEKTFNKVTIGFTGFGNMDLDHRGGPRQASAELGGLLGYDFGRFSVTAIVTRSVFVNEAGVSDTIAGSVSHALTGAAGFETRGWFHVVVPLYVAPPPPSAVVARY